MEHITYNIFLLAVLVTPGLIGHNLFLMIQKGESNTIKTINISRVIVFSVLAYCIRALIGTITGYGDAHLFVYFENVENVLNYIVITLISVVMLVYCEQFLKEKTLPLWLGQTSENTQLEQEEQHGSK